MPYKDEEKRKELARERMRKRRQAAQGETPAPPPAEAKMLPRKKVNTPPPAPPAPIPPPPAQVTAVLEKRAPDNAAPLTGPGLVADLSMFTAEQIEVGREVIRKTLDSIEKKGWVMWKCAKLNNDLIVIVGEKNVKGYPSGYPIYTLKEIEMTAGMSPGTIKLIHAAKVAGMQDALPGMFPIIEGG